MFFLVTLRVIAVVPGNKNEPSKLCMDELPMTALATLDEDESCLFQISDQLANLARHMAKVTSLLRSSLA